MKKFFLLIFPFLFSALNVNASVIYLASPGDSASIYSILNAAVTTAVDGDKIIFPSGTFKCNRNISTTKRISFKGAGFGATRLYRDTTDAGLTNMGYWFRWNLSSNSPDAFSDIQVTDIQFQSTLASNSPNDGGSVSEDWCLEFYFCKDVIVRNCSFKYFGVSGIRVTHKDALAGALIRNNYFSSAKGYNGLGYGYGIEVYGEGNTWVASPQFGSSNFIFIENNFFNELRHSIASNEGSLFVARYNVIKNNIVIIAAAIDTHPASGGNKASRACEIYGNLIINDHFRIHQWANAAARAAYVPYHASDDWGIQLDNGNLYRSNGTTAGSWTLYSGNKGNHLGAPFVTGKNATELGETAINMRGGEVVAWGNTITNWRFGLGVSDPTGYAGAYPVPYSPGYASGSALGSGHSGSSSPQNDGDFFYWNNTFTPYAGATSSQLFWNYTAAYFTSGRDYHNVARPSYTPYRYPHPLSYGL